MDRHVRLRFASAARRFALVALIATGTAWDTPPAHAEPFTAAGREALELLGARMVPGGGKAVAFRQVQFAFDAGRSVDTDWGQAQADVGKLCHLVGDEGGYLNWRCIRTRRAVAANGWSRTCGFRPTPTFGPNAFWTSGSARSASRADRRITR
ncbi:hypothetical protein BURK1_00335 [Burkholderiales bacterium]|nr:hypothetical protein BURK1_00335 [Burkholderiales bacterium]